MLLIANSDWKTWGNSV